MLLRQVLIMHTNLLIALVSLSAAVALAKHHKCAQLCKLMSFGLGITIDESWSKACNCFPEKQYKSEAFKPWSEVGPVVKLDNSGIYYEPAEIPLSQLSVIDQPFYIVNPVRVKEDKSLKKHTTNSPFKNYYNYIEDGDITSFRKQKRRENIPESNINLKPKEIPIYLDIDVKELTDVLRQVPPIEETRIPSLTEEVLINCMDLYVFIQSRKNNSYSKLKEIWGVTKFKKYTDLTDSQLEREIKDKCSQPNNIVEQSRKDIFQNSPRTSKNELRLAPNAYNKLNNDHKTFQHSMVKYKVDTEASNIVSSTLGNTVSEEIVSTLSKNNADGSNNFSEKTTSIQLNPKTISPNILNQNNNSNSYYSDDRKTIESMQSITNKTDFYIDEIETTLSYFSERETELKTQSDFQTRKLNLDKIQLTAEPETHNTYHTEEDFSLDHSTVQAVILAYPTDTNDIDIRSTSISEALTTEDFINNEKFTNIDLATIPAMKYRQPLYDNESDHITRKNFVSSTSDHSVNTDNFTNSYLTTQYIGKHDTPLDDNTNPHLTTSGMSLDNDLRATTLPEERSIYSEKDVILPKIVTTEFSNDTVRSELDGTEQIPNNDFENDVNINIVRIEVNDTEQIHSNSYKNDFSNETIWNEVNGTKRIPNADFENNVSTKTVWSVLKNTEQIPKNDLKNDDSNGGIWREMNGTGQIANNNLKNDDSNSKILKETNGTQQTSKNYFNNYASNETVRSEVNSTEQLPNNYLKTDDSNDTVWSEINGTEPIHNNNSKNDDSNGTVWSGMYGTEQLPNNYLKNYDSNSTVWSEINGTEQIPNNHLKYDASEINGTEQLSNNYLKNDDSNGTIWRETNGTEQIQKYYFRHDANNETVWSKVDSIEHQSNNYLKNNDSNGAVWIKINGTEQQPIHFLKNDDSNYLKNYDSNGTVWNEINRSGQIPNNYLKNDDSNSKFWSEINGTDQIPKHYFKNGASNDVVRSDVNGTEQIPYNDFKNYVSNDTVWNATKQIVNNNFNNNDVESQASVNDDGLNNRDRLSAKYSHKYESSNFNHEKVKENIRIQSENADQNITGKLYFYFNKEIVPAKFIQNKEGQIHVGMDGISLCDKLKLTIETPKLLSMICKCVQTHSCESK